MAATSILERLGLHRPELRAWAMYDWANSAFMVTIVTAVFPIYFSSVAAADLEPATASFRFAVTTTVALTFVAVLAPVMGALADFAGIKKKMLGGFVGLGVVATACMYFIQQGDWVLAALLFAFANIGVTSSLVFADSLLPHIASPAELDRVSTAGYALGYLGGGLLLVVNLAWIQQPEAFGLSGAALASRLSFVSVAVWWLGFSIPLFRKVPEPARTLEAGRAGGRESHPGVVREAPRDAARTARVPAGVRDAAGVPHLQRRHRDHPSGWRRPSGPRSDSNRAISSPPWCWCSLWGCRSPSCSDSSRPASGRSTRSPDCPLVSRDAANRRRAWFATTMVSSAIRDVGVPGGSRRCRE